MSDERAKALIVYKSGHTMEVRADKLKVTRAGGEIREISWENLSPNPIYIGLHDIESVWEL